MTIEEVLKLPTEKIEAATDAQLIEMFGDLIPQSRKPASDSPKALKKAQADLSTLQNLLMQLQNQTK